MEAYEILNAVLSGFENDSNPVLIFNGYEITVHNVVVIDLPHGSRPVDDPNSTVDYENMLKDSGACLPNRTVDVRESNQNKSMMIQGIMARDRDVKGDGYTLRFDPEHVSAVIYKVDYT